MSRTWLFGLLGLLALGGGESASVAAEKKVAAKGRSKGGDLLLNPVWVDAAKPENHRYSMFRTRSTSVGEQAKRLTAYLPKELCIAALKKEGNGGTRATIVVGVSGGRTSPVTLVVAEGQTIQFVNHDPFPHKLYDVGKDGGLPQEETKAGATRTWKPAKSGTIEIRDALFPSVRSWVVVEPKVAATGYPNVGGDYVVRDLEPGSYELVAYFAGARTGKPLDLEVKAAGGDEQDVREPLVVAEAKKEDEGK
jgi:hypothetical protein